MQSILPLIVALIAVAVVLYLSYLFSRHLAIGAARINKSKYINVIDRVVLGQDKMIFIAMIGGKYYLLGSSTQSIHVLAELSEEDLTAEPPASGKIQGAGAFQSIFQGILSKKEKEH